MDQLQGGPRGDARLLQGLPVDDLEAPHLGPQREARHPEGPRLEHPRLGSQAGHLQRAGPDHSRLRPQAAHLEGPGSNELGKRLHRHTGPDARDLLAAGLVQGPDRQHPGLRPLDREVALQAPHRTGVEKGNEGAVHHLVAHPELHQEGRPGLPASVFQVRPDVELLGPAQDEPLAPVRVLLHPGRLQLPLEDQLPKPHHRTSGPLEPDPPKRTGRPQPLSVAGLHVPPVGDARRKRLPVVGGEHVPAGLGEGRDHWRVEGLDP